MQTLNTKPSKCIGGRFNERMSRCVHLRGGKKSACARRAVEAVPARRHTAGSGASERCGAPTLPDHARQSRGAPTCWGQGARGTAGGRRGAQAPGRRPAPAPPAKEQLELHRAGSSAVTNRRGRQGAARAKPQGSEEARFVLSPCAWCCTPPPLPESGWNRSCGPWRGSAAYTHRRHSHRKLDAMQATGSRLATSPRVLPLCGRASRWRPKLTGRARRG